MKYLCIAWGMMWVSVAAAIGAAIYFTDDMRCLFFFIIPLLVGTPRENKEDNKDIRKDDNKNDTEGKI